MMQQNSFRRNIYSEECLYYEKKDIKELTSHLMELEKNNLSTKQKEGTEQKHSLER